MSSAIIHNEKDQVPVDSFRVRIKKRSDRLMNYFLGIYFIGGFIAAPFYNTWLAAITSGGIALIIYYTFKAAYPHSNIYQYVLSCILGLFMMQYITQMHGMYEMYFFAFIGSAILITYQNWKLQIPLLIIVIVHLSVFGYHQGSGFDKPYFMGLKEYELQRFVLHIIFTVLIFFICGLWGYLLQKYSAVQVSQTREMERLQKEALRAVKEQAEIDSNNRFSYATMATSDAIWDRNYDEDTVFWSDGYKTLFGYDITPDTCTIKFWTSKVHPEDIDKVIATIQKAKEDPTITTWSCEYRFLKINREYAFVREKAFIIRDEKGIPCRTIGALQDVTELKQNELLFKSLNESLAQEKYYLDCLMDNLPDAIYFKDRESRFVRVSRYMVEKHMTNHPGANINDLLGKTDFDIQNHVHAQEAFDDEQEIIRTGQPKIGYIEKELSPNGEERWVTTTKLPLLNGKGEVIGTFGISKDITRTKMLEKQQHDAMLEKAVAQGKFEIASDVMHDIGNAVVGFGSYLTRIRRLQDPGTPEKLKSLSVFFEEQKSAMINALGQTKTEALIKMLQGIAHSQTLNQEEISKIINEQLSNISRIEEILNIQRQYINGHEGQERKPVNIADIINDSFSMTLASADKTGISIFTDIAPDLPLIKGDRTKLMQLMLNVLKNSMEAVEENDHDKTIFLTVKMCDGRLLIQVKDNGHGFDKSVNKQLFSKGFTTKPSSSGLGLYNCRIIAESHDGTIDMCSDGAGKGTVTTIKFKLN